MGILMRKDQVLNLDRVLQRENGSATHDLGVSLEAIMGAGKTSVLLPLIALLNADGENLSVLVMPESLLPSMTELLQHRLSRSFQKRIEIFHIDRSSNLDASHLKGLYERLQFAKQNGKAVILSSSSLQSLFLKYIERLSMASDRTDDQNLFQRMAGITSVDSESLEEIAIYQKIFSLFRESGDLTLDEMDLILDVLKAHHFTMGARQSLAPEITA